MRAAVLALLLGACAGACSQADTGPAEGRSAPDHAPPSAASLPPSAAQPAPSVEASSDAPPAPAEAPPEPPEPPDPATAWARKLSPLVFHDVNTVADVSVRLYRDDGTLDEEAATEAERVLWAAKDDDPPPMSRRLLQLVVKAAAHFEAHEVQVISSHRGKARRGSRHRTGEAIDFAFPGVPPRELAELLHTFARVGVGLYIHPRSQFVHLDVREQSYHWVDGSPPGRSWREHALPDLTAAARDAAYSPGQDLPGDAG